MVRSVLAVIAGYLAMAVIVAALFSLVFVALGANGAFAPGTFDPSGVWIALSILISLGAAAIGGLVCAWISRGKRAPSALALIVLVLGLAFALGALIVPDDRGPNVRDADLGTLEAARQARQPIWISFLNPFLGVAGVMIGARFARRAGSTPAV